MVIWMGKILASILAPQRLLQTWRVALFFLFVGAGGPLGLNISYSSTVAYIDSGMAVALPVEVQAIET